MSMDGEHRKAFTNTKGRKEQEKRETNNKQHNETIPQGQPMRRN